MTNQTEKSVLENLHTSVSDLDLSREQGVIFIAVEPSGEEETKLIASIQGNPGVLSAAIYKAMSADQDLANLIKVAVLKTFLEFQDDEE